jgi:intraflagellar transport protein 46
MPDIETLMQEWPPEFEDLLKEVGLPTAEIDCDLATYVDMICGKCCALREPVLAYAELPTHMILPYFKDFLPKLLQISRIIVHFDEMGRNERKC